MITPLALTEPAQSPLLDVRTIDMEEAVSDYPRGQEILDRFPQAERIIVPSHWQIPALHGNDALIADWNTTKRTVLALGVKKTLRLIPVRAERRFRCTQSGEWLRDGVRVLLRCPSKRGGKPDHDLCEY